MYQYYHTVSDQIQFGAFIGKQVSSSDGLKEDNRMIILENEVEARYQLEKWLISTGYMDLNTEILEGVFK